MSTKEKDPLFQLIKSLSKSEKRQFRLYVGRLEVNANANFIALFNLIDRMDSFDEELVLAKTKIKKRQLSNAKAHLYKQVLISLKLSPLHQNHRYQIREQLDFASILYNKGLYKQSLKILDKAKSSALKYEELNLAYEIVELEKIVETQYITRSLATRADDLARQSKRISNRSSFASKLSNLSLELYSLMLKEGYAKNDTDATYVVNYFNSRLPQFNIEDLGFRERLFLYQAHLWKSLIVQDFLGSYKYAQKWVGLFDDRPEMKKLNPVYYLKGVNYLLEAMFYLRHPRFESVLEQLEADRDSEEFFLNDNTRALSFQYVFQHKINAFFVRGEFTKGTEYVPVILKNLEEVRSLVDGHHIMVFYYKIACLYFGAGDFENCIFYLSKIIQNKDLKMREDLLCFARVLNLVSHYEAGLDGEIESLIKSTYQFLIKMNELHKVQERMIQFLRSLPDLYPRELKGAFKALLEDLKIYEDHPYEGRAYLYLDIISWLQSHINNLPVEFIVKNKLKNGGILSL